VSGETVYQGRPWWLGKLLRGPADLASLAARIAVTVVIAGGALCTAYSGYIHIYLWGRQPYPYRDIPTIGPLFLAQGIAAVVIALAVIISRRVGALLVGAGLLIVSVAALVIDVEVGMFGFKDSWSVPYATATLYEEIAGAVLLLVAACVLAWSGGTGQSVAPRGR
jgi:low affinity Fe/Cu permease